MDAPNVLLTPSLVRRIALERFAKAVNIEIPHIKPDFGGAIPETVSLNSMSYNGHVAFPFLNQQSGFDISALPNSDWVGAELFPE